MPEDTVTQKYCDTQHASLDKRMDRLDTRLWWILTFVIITTIGMLSNIAMKVIDRAMPQAQAATNAK